jgi:hypothetical protein
MSRRLDRKFFASWLSFSILLGNSCFAQPGPPKDSLQEIARAQSSIFGNVDDLSFQTSLKSKATIGDRQLEKISSYKGSGAGFWLKFKQNGMGHYDDSSSEDAYDGNYFQHRDGPFITIRKQLSRGISHLHQTQGLLLPYAWFNAANIIREPKTLDYYSPSLADLGNLDLWLDTLRDSEVVGWLDTQTVRCLKVKIPSMVDGKTGHYFVYFSERLNWQPIRWESWMESKERKGLDYEVKLDSARRVSSGKGRFFTYYEHADIKQYCGGDEPCAIMSVTTQDVVVNQGLTESDFTLDPATAKYIFDADSKRTIKVPR